LRLLLDTHTFLWFTLGDPQISAAALAAINDLGNDKLVSPVTYWEIAIKVSINKLVVTVPYEDFLHRGIVLNGFGVLHVEPRHTARVAKLPFHHKDPFDRLLIAQALVDDLTLVSNEALFASYGVKRLW
jgi:PIN domain nuclease of toxin-antitoxin system